MPDTSTSDDRASAAIRGADVHGDGDALDLVADELHLAGVYTDRMTSRSCRPR
jgi:hypothetical protein